MSSDASNDHQPAGEVFKWFAVMYSAIPLRTFSVARERG
jgi:hypothetical protein